MEQHLPSFENAYDFSNSLAGKAQEYGFEGSISIDSETAVTNVTITIPNGSNSFGNEYKLKAIYGECSKLANDCYGQLSDYERYDDGKGSNLTFEAYF